MTSAITDSVCEQHHPQFTMLYPCIRFVQCPYIGDLFNPQHVSLSFLALCLFVVLGQYLLSELDVLVLGLLLRGVCVDDLLPLVVFGLALRGCQLRFSLIVISLPPSGRH
jgi:hypothetical protein